jgi:hypothetical protein
MGDVPACGFSDLASYVFVAFSVLGGWLWERRRRREMGLSVQMRSPTPWRQIVLYVWFVIAATYTTEFAVRWADGCRA